MKWLLPLLTIVTLYIPQTQIRTMYSFEPYIKEVYGGVRDVFFRSNGNRIDFTTAKGASISFNGIWKVEK